MGPRVGPEEINPRTYTPYRDLWYKLEGVAQVELADVIHDWADWTPDQAARLRVFLERELGPGGCLYASKTQAAGHWGTEGDNLGEIRTQARRLCKKLDEGKYQRRPGEPGDVGC